MQSPALRDHSPLHARWVAVLTLATFVISPAVFGATPRPAPTPVAPPSLGGTMPSRVLQCSRLFLYREKLLACDSFHLVDGENLRPILTSVPSAIESLDRYQNNRRSIVPLAYVGTVGVVFVLLGTVFGSLISDSTSTRNALAIVGGTTLLGSLTYGIFRLQNNEQNLRNAIETYNQAMPHDPVHLKFNATFELY